MTTFTNRHNIDPAIAKAITSDPFYGTPDSDISVTELIGPPQIAALRQQHQHEIQEDVSERLWALLGSAAHEVLKAGADELSEFPEERLYCEVDGWKIGGKADLYRPDQGQLVDYKVTSVYSFLLGDKPDWAAQLNFYAHIWRENGFLVNRLTIAAILRDWMRSKAGDDYPPVPFMQVDVPLWEPKVTARRMLIAVHDHKAARAGQPRPCTPEERWERPTKYAVMKRGQKRAVKLFDSEADALALIEAKRPLPMYLEERPGESVRCASYCPVREWCEQADELGVPHG